MLTRAGALIVLAATTPIAAAGLVSDVGRSWFWKSLRWFHAAAFTPVLMVLVLGVGIQMTSGVVTGHDGRPAEGHRHRRARRHPHLHRLLDPAGPVQDARVHRPGHLLRRRDAHRDWPPRAACRESSPAGTAAPATTTCGGVEHRRARTLRRARTPARRDHHPHHRRRQLPDAGSGPGRAGRRRRSGPGRTVGARAAAVGRGPDQPDGRRALQLRPRLRHHRPGGSGTSGHPATRGDDDTPETDPAGDTGGGGGAGAGGAAGPYPRRTVAPAPAASVPPPGGGAPGWHRPPVVVEPAAGGWWRGRRGACRPVVPS